MSLQTSTFRTAHVLDNEIIKANDFEFAFEQLIENVSRATQMLLESEQDFVINGKVVTDSGMNLKVSPIYGVCKSTGIPFGRTEITDETLGFEGSESGRIDIIQVQGVWETYDEQQRAFNDPDTDTQTYQYVDTKKLMKPVYQIKKGVEGAGVAPDTDNGWVKLAEISIRAGATSILASDIHNITADVAGLDNEDWTNEEDATYNIGYISDVNARFRVQHNEDGTHKENVIDAISLDIGTGANQINGNILPVGGAVSIPTQTIASVDSILSVITKIAAMITTFYNNYLKFGTYGFNGEMKLSSLLDDGALVKPISISAAGDGTAVIKVDNVAVLTITAAGQLAVSNTYNATATNHLVTKAITDALNNSISSLATRVAALENSSQNSSANKVLSSGTDGQFNVSEVALMAATTENIVLNGLSTSAVDGVTLTTDDYILVKNQTDKTENGVYYFVPNGAWGRVDEFDVPTKLQGKILKVPNGTVNKGKMFYTLNEYFEDPDNFGTDQIMIAEYFGSIAPVANKIIMRDAYGRAKVAAPAACDDIARKAEIDALYGNCVATPLGYASVGTSLKFAREDHVHSSELPFASEWLWRTDCWLCCATPIQFCDSGLGPGKHLYIKSPNYYNHGLVKLCVCHCHFNGTWGVNIDLATYFCCLNSYTAPYIECLDFDDDGNVCGCCLVPHNYYLKPVMVNNLWMIPLEYVCLCQYGDIGGTSYLYIRNCTNIPMCYIGYRICSQYGGNAFSGTLQPGQSYQTDWFQCNAYVNTYYVLPDWVGWALCSSIFRCIQ